jgi:XisH protein
VYPDRSAADVDFEIDWVAEQLLAAELEDRKIAVEVKSFISPSNVSEFHTALGQFLNYRDALEKVEPDRQLFLAVREPIYQSFFQKNRTMILDKKPVNAIWNYRAVSSVNPN